MVENAPVQRAASGARRPARRATTRLLAALVALTSGIGGVPAPAAAQHVDQALWEREARDQPFELAFGFDNLFKTDIAGAGGDDLERNSYFLQLGYEGELAENLRLDLATSYQYTNYDLAGSNFDWDQVQTLAVTALLHWRVAPRFSLLAGPTLRVSAEVGGEFDASAISAGGVAGVLYHHDEGRTAGVGLVAISRIEEDPLVLPLPFVRWRLAERWQLRVGVPRLGATTGPGAEVAWRPLTRLEFGVGAQYQLRRFRLDDNGGNAPDGVGQDRSLPVYARARWDITRRWGLDVFIAAVTSGNLRVENEDGERIVDRGYDPHVSTGFTASYRF